MNRLFLLALSTLLSTASAQALLIDSFDYDSQVVSLNTSVDNAGTLGGEVDIVVQTPTGDPASVVSLGGGVASATATTPAFPGALFANAVFHYDGNDNSTSNFDFGLGPLDLSGTVGMQFEVKEGTFTANSRYQLQAFTASGSAFSLVATINGTGTYFHAWNEFDQGGMPDLSNITAFTLNVIIGLQQTLVLDDFQVIENSNPVPEPASSALIAGGLLFGALRRKQRK